jgi:predicted Fe-Mo cluster-binding NifX family protein
MKRLARRLLSSLAMNVALPVWNGRISPVFDVARTLTVVELDQRTERQRRAHEIRDEQPQARIAALVRWEVDLLICGAISPWLLGMLEANGVHVIAMIRGDFEDVLHAFVNERLDDPRLSMLSGMRTEQPQ